MNFDELERQITDTKNRLRGLIPKLIECRNYLNNFSEHIDAKNDPLKNEQIAKDQLIIPVLRELGYKTEYDNGSLDVWAETCLSNDTAQKVDYAVFLEGCRYPRMILEAKALEKMNTKRSDYKSPVLQASTYYNEYSERILVAILSNGDQWVILGRGRDEGKKRAIVDPNKAERFVLDKSDSDSSSLLNLSSETGLDRFVRLLSKPTLIYSLEGLKDDGNDYDKYDSYRKDLKKRIYLKQALQAELEDIQFKNVDAFKKYLEHACEDLIRAANARAKEAGAGQESMISLEEIDATTKAAKREQETKRNNQLAHWKRTLIALFNELKSIPDICKNDITKKTIIKDIGTYSGLEVKTAVVDNNSGETNESLDTQDSSKDSEIDYVSIPEGENNEFLYSNIEQQIAHKIWSILNDSDIGHNELWNDDARQDDCLVKHLNSAAFISFLVVNPNIDRSLLIPVPKKRHDLKSQYYWAIRLGNRYDNMSKDDYAENELNGNAAIGFRIDTEDEYIIIQSLIDECFKDKLSSKNLSQGLGMKQSKEGEQNLRCLIPIDSVSDLDYLKNAIVYCYRKQIDKLLCEIG